MKILLLCLGFALFVTSAARAAETPPAAGMQDAPDDLPPPRARLRRMPAPAVPATTVAPAVAETPPAAGMQDAPDDLPPPRARSRSSAVAPVESVAPAVADELPAPAARLRKTAARASAHALKWGADDLLLEGGVLPDNTPEADTYSTLRASAFVSWQPGRAWEFRAGARLDGLDQAGGRADHSEILADYTDTYVRYRSGDTRLTLGAQTIVWGRVDEVPLADRVSRVDLTRFSLDDLADRRRAQLALRWEQNFGDYKLDAVALPLFRAAQLPDIESVWSPINRTSGRIVGLEPGPAVAALVGVARVDEDEHGSGGGAVRLTKSGAFADVGLTLARTRQSLPYYRLDPATLALTAVHPYNTFVGADMEMARGGVVWRMEFGYTDDVPFTRPDAAMRKGESFDWVGAAEFFPGGGDTRVNLQLVAHSLDTRQGTLELNEYYGANGEVEKPFGNGRWRASLRFAAGINVEDWYLGPRLSYVGWEPHELYLAGHYFEGEGRTLGGFQEDHSLITLGLRTRF